MHKKRNTIIFAALVIFVAFAGLLVQETLLKKEGSYAVIQSHGMEEARLPSLKILSFCSATASRDTTALWWRTALSL